MAVLVHSGITQINHVTKRISAISGDPVSSIVPVIGKTILCDGVGADGLIWSGHPTSSQTDITLACVVVLNDLATSRSYIHSANTTNSGFLLGTTGGSNKLSFILGNVASYVNIGTLVTGVPYFFAGSYKIADGAINLLFRRLDTEVVSTGTATGSTSPINGDGVYTLGARGVFVNNGLAGHAAMGFITLRALSMAELILWSHDPFGPFRMRDEVGVVVGLPVVGGLPPGMIGIGGAIGGIQLNGGMIR